MGSRWQGQAPAVPGRTRPTSRTSTCPLNPTTNYTRRHSPQESAPCAPQAENKHRGAPPRRGKTETRPQLSRASDSHPEGGETPPQGPASLGKSFPTPPGCSGRFLAPPATRVALAPVSVFARTQQHRPPREPGRAQEEEEPGPGLASQRQDPG
ncbi:tropomodulin-4 [Platysternon megacephalum]|uniref:Tropomodulin-4 n=1 Tax=Platysternon megacephalum TaxID=55544 RepID=A0A4D9EBZ9_9SAUR|nr:tropomodulin-4 [Platysternon megacephalum]